MKTPQLLLVTLPAVFLVSCATIPAPSTRWLQPLDEQSAPTTLDVATVPLEVPRLQENATAAKEDGWRFVVAPYGWLLSVDGNANIAGNESTIDQEFSDILDQVNFVAEARFEAWKGRHGILLDATYSQLESDVDIGPLSGTTKTDLALIFAGYINRLVEQEYKNAPGGVTVDGLAGIAYTFMDGELDIDNGPDSDGDEDILDPICGLRARWEFNPLWGASLETIIGGFEIFENSSDLITMSTALVGRKVGKSGILYFGWRTLDIDYENDKSGSKQFDLNININGPIIGYEWGF